VSRAGLRSSAWIILAVAYVALIFFVSSRPYLRAPGPEFAMKDKLAHTAEYGILGILLASALARRVRRSWVVAFLLALTIGATIAATDEMFQGTVPGRRRDVRDWAADVTGLALGGGLVFLLARRRVSAEGDRP
jgi:VanZ family protein